MAVATVGTIQAVPAAGEVFTYTATGGETLIMSAQDTTVQVVRVYDANWEKDEPSFGYGANDLSWTSIVTAGSNWEFRCTAHKVNPYDPNHTVNPRFLLEVI